MTVHNEEKYLRESIESILGQTYTDLEFIIIDDGSSDLSADITGSYDGKRIRLISNIENLGQPLSLNKGLDAAVGKYIARIDGDDVSLPERLTKEIAFMEAHPDVGVCGPWLRMRERNKLGNLSEYLSLYRVHKDSITSTKVTEQLKRVYESVCRNMGMSNISYEGLLTLLPL